MVVLLDWIVLTSVWGGPTWDRTSARRQEDSPAAFLVWIKEERLGIAPILTKDLEIKGASQHFALDELSDRAGGEVLHFELVCKSRRLCEANCAAECECRFEFQTTLFPLDESRGGNRGRVYAGWYANVPSLQQTSADAEHAASLRSQERSVFQGSGYGVQVV